MRDTPNECDDYMNFTSAGWRGVVRADWRELAEADPWQQLASRPCRTIRQRPASHTIRVELPDGAAVYAKHLTPQSKRVNPLKAWADRLRYGLGGSMALRIMRISRRMQAAGFATPPVLLAASRRREGRSEHLLVTEEVEGRRFLDMLREARHCEPFRPLLQQVGRSVAELHRRGFYHGDLLTGNLIITPDQRIVFIDNDRTRRWPLGPLPAPLRCRNLVQIGARLTKAFAFRCARCLFDAYEQAAGMDARAARRLRYRVLKRIRKWIGRRRQS